MLLNLADIILVRLIFFQVSAAFKILYKLHTKSLLRVAMQLTAGDTVVSGEIVQKTWSAALDNLPASSPKLRFGNWLLSILVNCSREYHHSTKRYMYLDNNFGEFSRFPKLKRQGMTMGFEKALSLLPASYRHVFILRDVCGYENRHVAEMLRITDGTCTSHLFRARNALIWLLPELYPFPSGQFLEWSEMQLKIFRGAYANVAMPDKSWKILIDNYLPHMLSPKRRWNATLISIDQR